jgi:hypothetical protein
LRLPLEYFVQVLLYLPGHLGQSCAVHSVQYLSTKIVN